MQVYLSLINKQFNEARGFSKMYSDVVEYRDELAEWLHERKQTGKNFVKYAESNGIYLKEMDTIELNKGKLDSLDIGSRIVSPFDETCKSELIVYQGSPIIKMGAYVLEGQVADIFFTHNPYSMFYLNGLAELHNAGHKICFGIFGKMFDKDKDSKFKLIRDYSSKFDDNIEVVGDFNDDDYYLLLYSNYYQKKLVKSLNRGR